MSESFDSPAAPLDALPDPQRCCVISSISGGLFHHETCKTPHCTALVVTERISNFSGIHEVKKPCGRALPCERHSTAERSNG